jgi:hypothetical protein
MSEVMNFNSFIRRAAATGFEEDAEREGRARIWMPCITAGKNGADGFSARQIADGFDYKRWGAFFRDTSPFARTLFFSFRVPFCVFAFGCVFVARVSAPPDFQKEVVTGRAARALSDNCASTTLRKVLQAEGTFSDSYRQPHCR